jgi:hypothetical protein
MVVSKLAANISGLSLCELFLVEHEAAIITIAVQANRLLYITGIA